MSFFSDLFEGNFSSLGTDVEHAPSSLANNPTELEETLGGVAALATGGLALGGLGALGGAAAGLGDIGAGAAEGGAGALASGTASGADIAGTSALGFADAAGDAGAGGAGAGAIDAALSPSAVVAQGFSPSGPGPEALSPNAIVDQGFSALGTPAVTPDPIAGAGGPIVGDIDSGASGFAPDLGDQGLGLSGGASPDAGFVPTTAIDSSVIPDAATSTVGTSDVLSPGGGGALSPASLDQTALNAPNASSGAAPAQSITPEIQSSGAGDNLGIGSSSGTGSDASGGDPNASGGSAKADGGWLNNTKDALSIAAPLASLGYLGYTVAKGAAPVAQQAQQVQANSAPLTALANTDLSLVTNNQLTSSQAASIAQQQAQLTSQWRQVLMKQGVTNPEQDSRWPQIQALIDQQMTAATQSMIQTTLQTALGASGQANSNLLQVAQLQVQQDTNYTNAIGNATKALGSTVAATNTVGNAATKLAA